MSEEVLFSIEEKMSKAVDGLRQDLATIRTGRASPSLIENLKIEYAGAFMPLNQVASISVPDANLLVIQPWDKSVIRNIEKAIQMSDLGFNPMNDGQVIRITIPPLSEERRQEMIKMVRKRVEERRVTVRNLRRDAMDELKEKEKNKDISQDEQKRASNQLQKITDSYISDVEQIGRDKEAELMQV
ncbi:ribosome recycling factor [Chloroflexota bacterium]